MDEEEATNGATHVSRPGVYAQAARDAAGKLLKRLEALVPWERLEARIEPHYPKAGNGRRPYALSVMLRVHLVQLCYNPVRDMHRQRKRDQKPTEAPDNHENSLATTYSEVS